MDSLDTWLNTRRGWSRFAVAWLVSLPAGVALSEVWIAWSDLFDPAVLGSSAVLGRVALGIVASVPLAVLFFSIESLVRRRLAKRGKNRPLRYLWRWIAAVYILSANPVYSMWTVAQPPGWGHRHAFVLFAPVGLNVIAVALLIWNLRYSGRLKAGMHETS